MSWYATVSKFTLAASVVLLSAGCDGRKQVALSAKDDTIRRQEEMIANERAEKEKAAEMNKQLADQNTQLAEKNAAIAKQQAEETARMNAKMGDLEGLVKDLGLKLAKSGSGVQEGESANVSRRENGAIVITVAGMTLFDAGKADLKTSAHPTLSKICSTIKQRYPSNYIRVEGHTDSTPIVHSKSKFADNMALSIARSRAVYEYMAKSGGIAANKMYTAGYGEFQPLVHPEKTAADRAKNRRVEIVIMPDTVKVTKERLAEAKPAPASITNKK
jgi:chemotaxis protein MotB